jgi:uncharacterized beta-barrel protein YwiB (DUF1934 family)
VLVLPITKTEQIRVKINVKTTIQDGDNKESFEITAVGRYYKKEHSFYLQYEETSEEGEIRTVVKIAGDEALILRSGSVKMRLPFRLHEELNGSYETPYGTLLTTVLTKAINYSDLTNSDGFVDLVYELSTQGSDAGTYHLQMTFKEEIQ